MTKYREIIRLTGLGFSQRNIMASCGVSQKTVVKVQKRARELNISWPLDESMTDTELQKLMFSKESKVSASKKMPDYAYIRKELLRNGVTKKLLWTEYIEDCRANGEEPLMYSQFCYHIQQDEQKHRATMHINRKPGEQVEVDWAGDPATIIDPDTGEILKSYIFVGVMTYSQYAYVEAFLDMKQRSWINAHVHMYEYFGGVARILVPDNCKTAVIHNGGWKDQQINETYQELAEHYCTAIIPARVRAPKDKPNAEGTVGNISTWITAALRDEQFFSLAELNRAIKDKLELFNQRLFQKKEGSRRSLFLEEEKPLLAPLPATRFELSDWKTATVQFNYHISVDGMLYSVPYEYIKKKVDVKITDTTIEIFYNHNRIASHRRLKGRPGKYSTVTEHMPEDHQKYLEWNGDRFRKWAERIGINTYTVVNAILTSKRVEQQTYRSCMGLLKLAEKYSDALFEAACKKALSYTASPSYKSIKNILVTGSVKPESETTESKTTHKAHGITRGADYYRRLTYMTNQSIIDKLIEMRLTTMADAFRNQLDDTKFKDVPFEDRFGMLVDIEYSNRKNNRQKRLIRNAGFDQPEASIMDINYTSGRKLNKGLINRLATCEYISEHRNLFITGATGCGKTYMACAFGMEACKQYFNTKYVRLPDLLIDLETARTDGNYKKVMAKYANPVVLILDEWLLLKPTNAEQRDIFELLHRRRKKSSTIFCSQYAFEEWYEQLGGGDSPLADAIIDRIAHDSYRINITSIDAEHDRSMREVYGLDKALRE